MDPPARQYVSELKELRKDDATRADARRALRTQHLVAQQRERQKDARDALRFRVQQRIRDPQNAVMEQSLFDTIRRTAAWWDAICDHAVEQKMHMERATRNQRSNRTDYLRSVKWQEKRESTNILSNDAQRWRKTKEAFLTAEREGKAAAVQGVVETLLTSTNACIDFLDKYTIQDSKNNVLAQFGLSEVIRGRYLQATETDTRNSSNHSTEQSTTNEAFRGFFKGKNPFQISSDYFPSFLLALLHKTHREGFHYDLTEASATPMATTMAATNAPAARGASAKLIFDVSRVPVFVVSGAKYSGKSILTEHLVSTFGLRCYSDRDLVSKAVLAHQQASDASSEALREANPLWAEWAEIGKAVHGRLLVGGSVPHTVVAQLLALQLREVQTDTDVKGVIFDGVLSTAEAFQAALETVLPGASDAPLQALVEEWCGPSAHHGAALSAACSDVMASAWLPPTAAPAEEQQPKKEAKSRASKKVVDMASLPPAVLPPVDDVAEEVRRERVFVERATQELASGYGGLVSAFFYMDCPPEEIFQRYAGLRRDKETGEEYHMTYLPPPEERIAHLVNVDRTTAHTAQLADLVFEQQQQWQSMRRWLHERPSSSAAVVVELDGAAPIGDLTQQAAETVQQAMANFATGMKLREALETSRENIDRLEDRRRAQESAREAERQRLAALYTEKGVSPLPPELQECRPSAAAAESGELSGLAGTAGSKGVFLQLCEEVPRGTPEVVFPALHSLTQAYKATFATSWEQIAGAANLLLGYRIASQSHVRRYWETTPDDKQALLNKFVSQFNAVPNRLRSRSVCKDELHGLIDELKRALFAQVVARKEECAALIDATTHRDAFLDNWDATMCSIGLLLMQVEAVRFTTIANLVVLYFSTLVGESLPVDEADVLDLSFTATAAGRDYSLLGLQGASSTTSMPGTRGNTAATGGTATASAGLGSGAANPAGKRLGPNGRKGNPTPHAGAGAATGNASGTGAPAGGGNAVGLSAAKSGGPSPDGGAHGTLESFADTAHRVMAVTQGFVDRLRAAIKTGGTKAEKKAAAATSTMSLHTISVPPAKLSAIVGKSLPILDSELAKTHERIGMVRDFLVDLMQQGEAYRQRVRGELHSEATEVLKAEAAAVNSAIYVLRSRVEEERLAPDMHLGCGTFAVLREPKEEADGSVTTRRGDVRQPSFLTDVPLYQEMAALGVKVHATLTAARLFELINTFVCVAPDYQLSRDDFILSVSESDYAGAAAAAAAADNRRRKPTSKSSTDRHTSMASVSVPAVDSLKPVADVFRAFDPHETGFMDWREFIMHLLFWCAPPPARLVNTTASPKPASPSSPTAREGEDASRFYIPEVRIEQLLALRAVAGVKPLSEEAFRSLPFFFEEHLSDDRHAAYTEALWRTFRHPQSNLADAYAFFFFLCSDMQPIRGAQKAFYVLAATVQEGGCITRTEMERLFHTHATNPRNMGGYDAFSRRNQNLLFGEGEEGGRVTVSFQDMCNRLMGRKMLNTLDIFRRKRFVFADVS